MSKVVQIKENGNLAVLLAHRSPTSANSQLVRELNGLASVDVSGVRCEVTKLESALAAVANIEAYMTPHRPEKVGELFRRWKFLFQRPYETSMEECSARVDMMSESMLDLPADCIMHVYNQSIKTFRILPPYSDVYGLIKTPYEKRKLYLDFFQNKVDELRK